MSEFQLTHIALVGARMDSFEPMGISARNELSMRRIVPDINRPGLAALSPEALHAALCEQLPIWIHNIITDQEFPLRHKLVMPLRRFEGELNDNKNDEIVSAVLSSGFKNTPLNPLDLPQSMSMRQRCAMIAHLQVWQDAYTRLEKEVVEILADHATELSSWCEYASHPDHAAIA